MSTHRLGFSLRKLDQLCSYHSYTDTTKGTYWLCRVSLRRKSKKIEKNLLQFLGV